jgi:hypothetical protein
VQTLVLQSSWVLVLIPIKFNKVGALKMASTSRFLGN